MFSGIVSGTGKIYKISKKEDGISIDISAPKGFNINKKNSFRSRMKNSCHQEGLEYSKKITNLAKDGSTKASRLRAEQIRKNIERGKGGSLSRKTKLKLRFKRQKNKKSKRKLKKYIFKRKTYKNNKKNKKTTKRKKKLYI